MSKEKEILKIIPRFYRKGAEDIGLFFWVRAQLDVVPTIKIEQAIMSYLRFIGASLDEWDMDCARTIYYRMQKDFLKQ